jgi:hypothetical protein
MLKRSGLFIGLFSIVFIVFSQDAGYVKYLVDTLSAPGMYGRGYVNDGDRIAASFIESEFRRLGLKSFGNEYLQPFSMPINTFPDTLEVLLDGKKLIPGEDFVLLSNSPSVNDLYDLVWSEKDSVGAYSQLPESDLNEKVLVIERNQREFLKIMDTSDLREKIKGVIFLQDGKPWWHVSIAHEVKLFFALQVKKEKISEGNKTISIKAKNDFFSSYQTQNVVGYVEGTTYPDSFFVFTAHYDHLGMMGSETYFPGANDNASGTAAILDLARFYSIPENRPEYSVVFIAFGAEEAGLLGSLHFTANPLFPLEKIRFLINLDMIGSGSEGIKVVNGAVFEKEFEKLERINADRLYLTNVSTRGEAANSDHYPFYAKGVPCFFIYTLGDECKEYHNIYDVPENVPFTEYSDLFLLLTEFIKTY